jgi:NCAIR mutase (PurE)-related protein
MSQHDILNILNSVGSGDLSPQDAMLKLKLEPFQDLGFAKVDHHRELRQGAAEVIYGAGKNTGTDNRHRLSYAGTRTKDRAHNQNI